MKYSPFFYKILLSFYPPYIGASIRIKYVSKDFKKIEVVMTRHWFNRNVVGTHFGGSLYSMVDPHFMFMLMKHLGKDYIVWDQAAKITFIKAVKKKVIATFIINDEQIDDIKKATASGQKYLKDFIVDIRQEDGTLVASVIKTLYIRKKKPK